MARLYRHGVLVAEDIKAYPWGMGHNYLIPIRYGNHSGMHSQMYILDDGKAYEAYKLTCLHPELGVAAWKFIPAHTWIAGVKELLLQDALLD